MKLLPPDALDGLNTTVIDAFARFNDATAAATRAMRALGRAMRYSRKHPRWRALLQPCRRARSARGRAQALKEWKR